MLRSLEQAVVVVTGASGGIGRATALAFARRRANVVVAARREGPLRELEGEAAALGGAAVAVPTDVADEAAVEHLAATAVDRFGRIDVWVNNAAVVLLARLEDAPMDEVRRVLDVDVLGCCHGARAALPRFREQGSGVLVNVGSMLSVVGAPYLGAYVMAKHAVRGLGATLRQELALDGVRGVHVCTVMPATIDTPLFRHLGNRTGHPARAMPPVYSPERVATTIVRCARFPRREVYVGHAARAAAHQAKLAPGTTERVIAAVVDRLHLDHRATEPPNPGNLFEPSSGDAAVDGGWAGRRRTALRRGLAYGTVAAVAAPRVRDRLRR